MHRYGDMDVGVECWYVGVLGCSNEGCEDAGLLNAGIWGVGVQK